MSYCPECGEQIAKDDIFCPFCGISIKPIVAVEDSSMSETIVDMPPVVINKEALDALTAKSNQESPKPEIQNAPVAEAQESSESAEKPQDTPAFSAGNTSENWTMKTESVEIPAEALEDVRSIPLPSVFGDDEPAASTETAPDTFEPLQSFDNETAAVSGSTEKTEEVEITGDLQTPASFENEETEFKAKEPTFEPLVAEPEIPAETSEKAQTSAIEDKIEEPQSFEPAVSETIDAPADFQDSEPEALISEEVAETVSEPVENAEESNAVPFETPENFEESDSSQEFSAPVSEEPQPVYEALGLSAEAEPLKEESEAEMIQPFAQISAEPEEQETVEPESPAEISEPEAKISVPPIEMPALPLILENREEPTRFDSVQIFQKDEVAEEKSVSAPFEPEILPAAIEETPSEVSKDGRPFTTPNMGNSDTDGRKAAKLKPLDEGTILNGRYEIVRKIGGGGMGAVYLANDRNLGGVLRAVKEMVQSYIESEQQDKAVSDFKRESLLLTSLEHTAIPTIYDYFFDEKEGRFYLVMKYISGGDLAGRLRAAPEGRIDEKSVTEWAIQIADVLHYLHNHEPSIVYRDLKPANVMIDGNSGRVMLIDFGIARWVNKEEKGVTAVGTMGYAPPELFSGNVEPRSDIYSLGSTMFHLLTGADPQSNPLLIFDFQKNPRPRQINSQLTDQIEQILIRSVEYNSEARFASAAEMRDALKEHLANLQIGKVTYGVKVAPSNRAFSEQAVFCGFCGKQIVATDVFCAFCGAQQPIAQQGVSNSSLAVQPLTAKLVIQETGELEPSSFRLEKTENLLGRRDPMSNIFPEVDLSKYDPQTKISRRHARIWREGNSFLVEDLGSSNGTTLLPSSTDSVRLLPHQPHTLTNGDKIRLGDTTLHFTIG
jgi:serine/threonine-protein kinase